MEEKLHDITPIFEMIGVVFIGTMCIRGIKSLIEDLEKINKVKKEKFKEVNKNA